MTAVHIGFDPDFEHNNTVAVTQEGELPEYLQIWVWDLYYASALHVLAHTPFGRQLRDTLEGWAGSVATDLLAPPATLRRQGLLSIDTSLVLGEALDPAMRELYSIEVGEPGAEGWPDIRVDSSRERTPNRLAYSVIALAQFFLAHNVNFARELPLHVLSIRKYLEEERPAEDPAVRMEAPLYAINKALKFFQDFQG